MKTSRNLLAVIAVLISITLFSCHAVKRTALTCPEFSKAPQKSFVTHKINWIINELITNPFSRRRNFSTWKNLSPNPYITYGMSKSQILTQMVASTSKVFIPQMTRCDTIFLRSGAWMNVQILNEGLLNFKYNSCDSPASSPNIVSKKGIRKVKYYNGNTKYFGPGNWKVPPVGNASKKNEPMGIIGFISTLMSPLFPFNEMSFIAIGCILGIISYFRIRKHPDKFKGKILAEISIMTMVILTFLGLLMALLAPF